MLKRDFRRRFDPKTNNQLLLRLGATHLSYGICTVKGLRLRSFLEIVKCIETCFRHQRKQKQFQAIFQLRQQLIMLLKYFNSSPLVNPVRKYLFRHRSSCFVYGQFIQINILNRFIEQKNSPSLAQWIAFSLLNQQFQDFLRTKIFLLEFL